MCSSLWTPIHAILDPVYSLLFDRENYNQKLRTLTWECSSTSKWIYHIIQPYYWPQQTYSLILSQITDYQIFGLCGLDGLRVESHNPRKGWWPDADLRKFSLGFVCECGVFAIYQGSFWLLRVLISLSFLSAMPCKSGLQHNVATFAAWVKEQLSVSASHNPKSCKFPGFSSPGVVGTFYLRPGRTWNKYI